MEWRVVRWLVECLVDVGLLVIELMGWMSVCLWMVNWLIS